jgi:serine acetyltransferase
MTQLDYLYADILRTTNRKGVKLLPCLVSESVIALCSYRLSRLCYLLLGRFWPIFHFCLLPLRLIFRPWLRTNCDISYRADIGPGLRIIHLELGLVVSFATVAGHNLTLTGGNLLGAKHKVEPGEILIGNDDRRRGQHRGRVRGSPQRPARR